MSTPAMPATQKSYSSTAPSTDDSQSWLASLLPIMQQHVIVSVTDHEGTILFANNQLCEISQYRPDELVGANHRILSSGHHAIDFYQGLWNTISQGQIWRGTFCDKRKDGSLFWLDSTITPELGPQGRPSRYIAISSDVTGHMAAKKNLISSHNRLQAMLSSLPVLLFALDGHNRFILIEGSAVSSLGIQPEALIGQDIRQIFPYHGELVLALERSLGEQSRRVELEWNGVLFATHLGALRIGEQGEQGLIGVAIDITGKRQMENALRLKEERLRLSQEYAGIGTWDYRVDRGELHISEHLLHSLGGQGERHCTLDDFIAAIHPEDRQRVKSALDASLRDGSPYDIEHRFIRDDGRELWLNEKGKPARSAAGEPLQMLGIIQDISERKQAENLLRQTLLELRAAKEEAEKANRAKSDFLSRISHELRTPLNSVLGFAQLLQYDDDPGLSTEQQEYVGHIIKSGNHLLQLINEVLDLAAIEVGKLQLHMENLPLGATITDCLAITASLARREGITLIDETRGAEWVRADALRLKQVLLNLLSNAIKYNRPQGQVRIHTSHPHPGRLRLHVADTGPGLPPDKLSDLFQPFNRLGLEYGHIEGSGIGLVITKSLVELMGGALGVDSCVGQGSTFWFELDSSAEQSQETLAASEPSQSAPKLAGYRLRGTVLYLEDNLDNQKLMRKICDGCGEIHLLEAANTNAALELASRHKLQLILMDMQLPGESGQEAYRRLRESPDTRHVPVVIVSADATASTIETALAAGVQAYLTKPLDLPALMDTLQRYLNP